MMQNDFDCLSATITLLMVSGVLCVGESSFLKILYIEFSNEFLFITYFFPLLYFLDFFDFCYFPWFRFSQGWSGV